MATQRRPPSRQGPSWLGPPWVSCCCRAVFAGERWEWGSQMGCEGLGLDGEGTVHCAALCGLLSWALSPVQSWWLEHASGLPKLWVSLGWRAAMFSSIFVRAQRSHWRNVPSRPLHKHTRTALCFCKHMEQGWCQQKRSVLFDLSINKGQLNKRNILPKDQEAQILLES